MIMRKKFVPTYLFSFAVGFVFEELMDLHELWITRLPLRVLYFVLSYLILCFGIALSNRCKLPIVPTDLFPLYHRGDHKKYVSFFMQNYWKKM